MRHRPMSELSSGVNTKSILAVEEAILAGVSAGQRLMISCIVKEWLG